MSLNHNHSDKEFKTCKIYQLNLKKIRDAGKELDKLGVWTIPKKIKPGIEYTIWRRKDKIKK